MTALALASLTLVAVLILSGLAKRPDPQSTHSMMRLLRLPGFIANETVARILPWGELAVAALLLTPWRWSFTLGAVAAVALFITFWVIVARAMTFDPRPTCGCFGRVGDHRINGRTVARNTILVGLALVSVWTAVRGETATGLLVDFTANDWLWLLLAVALAAVALFVLGSAPGQAKPLSKRQLRDLERQREEAAARAAATPEDPDDYVRRPIPRGTLVGQDHSTTTLQQLSRQQAQLVLLANCWCGSTVAAIDKLPVWRERLPQLGVQLVHTLAPWDEPRLAGDDGVWWDPGQQVYEALEAGASPAAVLLGADGLLAGGPVNGVEEIDQFVEDIAAELAEAEVELPGDETGDDVEVVESEVIDAEARRG